MTVQHTEPDAHAGRAPRAEPASASWGEALLQSVVDSLDCQMCVITRDDVILRTNAVWDDACARRGWGADVARTGDGLLSVAARLPEPFSTDLVGAVRRVQGGDTTGYDVVKGCWPGPDGPEYVVARVHPIHDHPAASAVITIVDISDAMRTEEQLRRVQEEARLLALVAQHTGNAVLITGEGSRVEWANQALLHLAGRSSRHVVGRPVGELFQRTPAEAVAWAQIHADIVRGNSAQAEFPARAPAPDARVSWLHVEAQPVIEHGRICRAIAVIRDVTAQHAAQDQLRLASERAQRLATELCTEKSLLTEVLVTIPHLVYWKDRELRFAGVNHAFLELRGLESAEDVLGRTETELALGDCLTELLTTIEPQVLASGKAVTDRRLHLVGTDRQPRTLLLSVLPHPGSDGATPRGVIGMATDISHVNELERQLAEASRLESIGQLAAGVAHEINTPVQFVADNTQFLAKAFGDILPLLTELQTLVAAPDPGLADPLRAALRDRLTAVDVDFVTTEIPVAIGQSQEGLTRVAQIVRAMKDFAHPGQEQADTDLNRAVDSTVQVSRNEWKYVAELHLDLDPAVGFVPCYEGELKQVVLNLIVNAAQALAEQRLRTSSVLPGPDGSRLGRIHVSTRREGDAVEIRIADDGPGMTEEVRTRVFDPFFTTKEVGTGTGQGLTIAHSVVVQKHRGTIQVASAPGRGAVFTITLPAPRR